MTLQTRTYHRVICEGCGQVHGGPTEHETSLAVRRSALAAGWQLVPKRRTNGRPCFVDLGNDRAIRGASSVAHDVCPACAPTFQAEMNGRAGKSSGGAWMRQMQDRIAALEAENSRLKGGKS